MRKIFTNSKRDEIEIRALKPGVCVIRRWNYMGSTNNVKSFSLAGEHWCSSDEKIDPAFNALANGEKFK